MPLISFFEENAHLDELSTLPATMPTRSAFIEHIKVSSNLNNALKTITHSSINSQNTTDNQTELEINVYVSR
jgi:hypothetical protein